MSFEGKIAIVTGAGRGIGRATAIELAKKGAKVVLAGKTLANLEKVKAEIDAAGGEAFVAQTDISKVAETDRLVKATLDKYGRIDLLVNNAAVHPVRNVDQWPRSEGCDEAFWDECMDVNARGPFFLTKAVLPEMAKQKSGRVVFVASVTGIHGKHASPPYNASKAAVICLTKSFADEYGPYGINVNCVCPGYVNTDMCFNQNEEAVAMFRAGTALRRTAEPVDISHTILSLLQDDLFVSGQTLVCDGGVVMR